MLPPFPQEPTPAKTYNVGDLVRWYDTLTNVGLHPIPKSTLDKRPLEQYMSGGFSRDKIVEVITSGQSDGWFIYPSQEPDVSLMVIDMDVADIRGGGNDPEALYNQLQALSPTNFVLYTPSGGVHLYYRLGDTDEVIERVNPRRDIRGLEIRTRAIGIGVASFCGATQYSAGKAKKKGVRDGFVGSYDPAPYGDYGSLPFVSAGLLAFLRGGENTPDPSPRTGTVHSPDAAADKRVAQEHAELPYPKKIERTLEALDWALKGFSGLYEDWLALWMSAWSASDGDSSVRDAIASDARIEWSDGEKGKRAFRRAWEKHSPREDGYTVGTLFKMAYDNGWLASSSAELDEDGGVVGTAINTARISDWLSELGQNTPRRVLLKSQTGSGKTWGLRTLWENLGKPKTVVLVPSIRLALDMASTLANEMGLPAVAYRDEETDLIRSDPELIEAEILITTLQTFARRLYVPDEGVMKRYGLLYIEECDQLLASFASGGGGELSSHVKQNEAERGFMALAEAFRDGVAVWGVDATATQVSYHAFSVLSGGDFLYVENQYVSTKPSVRFIAEHMAAYTLIQEKLAEGKSVVVPCDTAAEAHSVYGTMLALGVVLESDSLCITSATSDIDDRVLEFARAANEFAPVYRLLVYNSAMASGVSVTSFQPDVVVQLSRGYLTPRTQLQLLNRYRKQSEVYCWYGAKSLTDPSKSPEELLELAKAKARDEAEYLLIPLLDRTQLAYLRDELRAISQSDGYQQRRNPVQFYRMLLRRDGRDTISPTGQVILQRVMDAYKAENNRREEEKEYVASHWREVEAKSDAFPDEWNDTQVRQALVHRWISDTLKGNVPQDDDQLYVYEVCADLFKHASALHAFVFQDDAVRFSEKALGNKERAFMTHPNYVSRVVLAGLLRYLFRNPEEKLDPVTMTARAMPFLRVVEEHADVYHRVVRRPERSLDAISDKYVDEGQRAVVVAKNVAAAIGMKIRKHRAGYWHITNLQEVLDFLRWQNFNTSVDFDLSSRGIEEMREKRTRILNLYSTLTDEEMRRIVSRLMTMPLETAIAVSQGVQL